MNWPMLKRWNARSLKSQFRPDISELLFSADVVIFDLLYELAAHYWSVNSWEISLHSVDMRYLPDNKVWLGERNIEDIVADIEALSKIIYNRPIIIFAPIPDYAVIKDRDHRRHIQARYDRILESIEDLRNIPNLYFIVANGSNKEWIGEDWLHWNTSCYQDMSHLLVNMLSKLPL